MNTPEFNLNTELTTLFANNVVSLDKKFAIISDYANMSLAEIKQKFNLV